MILSLNTCNSYCSFHNAKLEVKSYPEVPFVKINQIYESEMELDNKELISNKFYETSFKDKSISRLDYKFDYDRNFVRVKQDTDGNTDKKLKVSIKKKCRIPG